MTLEAELEAVAHAAAERAGAGESVAAVMAAEPAAGERVYLVAYEADQGLSYVALRPDLEPVSDMRLVRDVVAMLAMAERAEEASGSTVADELVARLAGAAAALARAGEASAAAAAEDAAARASALAAAVAGPRVATPAYLDAVARAARELSEPMEVFRIEAEALTRRLGPAPGGPLDEAARAAWEALAVFSAQGDPAEVPAALAATAGAVEALADDVAARYRAA